ncbi:uncharacterized protein DEA37_0000104 [Paragonimus westermani]|uniref:Uncharacterized protein n=1 Tax=Paragonimus westermani TaxID=34504 RepID=A0A5J4P0H4_9TREM|nr:uncharacterized protein DEA37_0000104 [Paragonimus westermani]
MRRSWSHCLFTSVSLHFALILFLLPAACLSLHTTPVVNADGELLSVSVRSRSEQMSIFNSRALAAGKALRIRVDRTPLLDSLLSPFTPISDAFRPAQRSTEPTTSFVRRFHSTTDLLSVYRGRRIHSVNAPSLVPLALTVAAVGLLVLLLLLTTQVEECFLDVVAGLVRWVIAEAFADWYFDSAKCNHVTQAKGGDQAKIRHSMDYVWH